MPTSFNQARDRSHDSRMRRKIQRHCSVIIDKLVDHVKGTYDMSPSQVKAATALLAKSVPDLQSVELKAGDGGPIIIITGIDRQAGSTALPAPAPNPQVIDVTPSDGANDQKVLA